MASFDVCTSPFHAGEPVPVSLTQRLSAPVEPAAGAFRDPVEAVCEGVAQAVSTSVAAGRVPLLFAGDCLAPLGVVAGLQRAGVSAPAVVWFDAHGDFNTPETSPSGYLPGMALALIVGRGDRGLVERLGLQPVDERQTLLVDARDLDEEEVEALAAVAEALAATDRLCAVSFGMTFRADGLDADGAVAATDRLAAVLV